MQNRNIHSEYHDLQKLSPNLHPEELIKQIASKHGLGLHQAFAEAGLISHMPPYSWPRLSIEALENDEGDYTETSIFQIVKDEKIGKLIDGITKVMRFPKDSATLHAISCIASAMTIKKMRYQAGRWNGPVNLYTIISQPPSTAKSAINEAFSGVIDEYVEEVMVPDAKQQKKEIKIKIKKIEKNLKMAKTPDEACELEYELEELQAEMAEIKEPVYAITDTTPEALQLQSSRQGGWFTLVTAEQGLIGKMFGTNYGSGKSPDMDFILQSFNAEKSTTLRITREKVSTRAIGSVAILAQDIGISNMMKMGETGQGMPERFLFMREKSLLGKRNRLDEIEYPEKQMEWYKSFITEIMSQESGRVFIFDENCRRLINEKMNDYEEHMEDGRKYGSAFLQGVIGKGDGQIYRLASILHAVRSFKNGKLGSNKVTEKSVIDAINIYDQLKDAIVSVATDQGIAGDEATARAVVDALKELSGVTGSKKRTTVLPNGVHVISLAQFREAKRNSKPFKGYANLSKVIESNVEALAEFGVCAYHGKKIYISPRLFD